jgi:mannose-1-phosphate guanylyltransferase/phosphomannomutase
VTLREGAHVSRSVVDAGTYVGRAALVEGAVLGRNCDVRSHARLHEGVAIGDHVTIGEQAAIYPGVRIYPYKEVDSGAHVHESLIWESRASTRLFGKSGVSGLVNVDITPEVAVRLGAALGTALRRGARVVATRESAPAYRAVKRAIMAGLNSAGVHVADLRTLPGSVGKHCLTTQNYDAAFHVGALPSDAEVIRISFFERPGVALSSAMQSEIEKHFARQELRRVPFEEVGTISYPARARESYASDLLESLDVESIAARGFRIVVDYGYSAASYVLPLVLGPLGIEAITAHPFESDVKSRAEGVNEAIEKASRLVSAVGADLAAVFDRAAERLYLVDDQSKRVPDDQVLLLFLRLLSSAGKSGKVALPVTVTDRAEQIAAESLEVVRTPTSLPALTQVAARDGVIFAASMGGGYVFPDFLPTYDAVTSLCKLLELLAPLDRPLSELVAELPSPTLVHDVVQCPWALKGLVMRTLNERFADDNVDLLDGIKVFDERGWFQVLPDPDEPLIHLYAEGPTDDVSRELADEIRELLTEVTEGQEIGAARGT